MIKNCQDCHAEFEGGNRSTRCPSCQRAKRLGQKAKAKAKTAKFCLECGNKTGSKADYCKRCREHHNPTIRMMTRNCNRTGRIDAYSEPQDVMNEKRLNRMKFAHGDAYTYQVPDETEETGYREKKIYVAGDLQIGHIRPVSKGGLMDAANLKLQPTLINQMLGDRYWKNGGSAGDGHFTQKEVFNYYQQQFGLGDWYKANPYGNDPLLELKKLLGLDTTKYYSNRQLREILGLSTSTTEVIERLAGYKVPEARFYEWGEHQLLLPRQEFQRWQNDNFEPVAGQRIITGKKIDNPFWVQDDELPF